MAHMANFLFMGTKLIVVHPTCKQIHCFLLTLLISFPFARPPPRHEVHYLEMIHRNTYEHIQTLQTYQTHTLI